MEERGVTLLTAKLPAVVRVVLANGADNLAVYAPLFAADRHRPTTGAFLVLVALWCGLARTLGDNQPFVITGTRGPLGAPVVFLAVGTAMLVGTGALAQLLTPTRPP